MRQARLGALGALLVVWACGERGSGLPPMTLLTPQGADHPTSRFSPDGTRVAYWAAGPDGWDVRVARGDLIQSRKLASARNWFDPLLWSPDGRSIAFTSNVASFADVWLVPADGGEPRRLTESPGSEFPLQWHPSGDRLGYVATEEGGTIRANVVTVATGHSLPLLSAKGSAIGFWSPDGSQIAYTVHEAGKSTIWLADSAGQHARQLTTEGLEDFEGTGSPWRPDGSELLYVSRRTGTGDIWVLPVDGKPLRQLTHDVRNDGEPVWSPDGKWVAFVSDRGRQTDVWVVPSAGGTELRVTDDEAEESNLQWIPGSSKVAFHTGLSASELWAISIADGKERRFTPDSIRVGSFDISPDGTQVVYGVSRGGGVGEIQVVPLAGGTPRTLVSGPADNGDPYWSPDGKTVLFFSDRSGSGDLWLVHAAGGAPRPLTHWPTLEVDGEWSADGKSVYFLSGNFLTGTVFSGGSAAAPFFDLWVIPVSGGEPRRLTKTGTIQNVEPSRAGPDVFVTSLGSRAGQIVLSRLRPDGTLQTLWERSNVTGLSHRRISPSGDSLTMQAELPGGGFQSMMIPGNGGEGRPILGKLETAGPFSPDGTQLVYYFGSPAADLGLLSLKDGSTRRLTNTPENEGSTQWTPDGKEIVVLRSAQRRRIAVVDLGGLLHRR